MGLNVGCLKLFDPPEVDEGPRGGGTLQEGFVQCVTLRGEHYDVTPPRDSGNVLLGSALVVIGPRRVNGPACNAF